MSISLTEKQNLILSQLAYLDFTNDDDFTTSYKGKTLGEIADDLLSIDPNTNQPTVYNGVGDRIIGGMNKDDFKSLLETIAYGDIVVNSEPGLWPIEHFI